MNYGRPSANDISSETTQITEMLAKLRNTKLILLVPSILSESQTQTVVNKEKNILV